MKEEPVGCEKESLMIIKVVSKVLDQLIAGAKSPASNLGLFVKFQSSYAPEVSVQSYLERIRKYSRCSDACFVMALIYIDRLIECRQLMLSQLNVHRLLVTCVMVAAKFHDDLFYNNSYYAKLGGLPLSELNLLEIDLLKLMNFSLFIEKEAFAKYYQELKNYFFCLELVPSPVSVTLAAPGSGNLNSSFHAATTSSPMAGTSAAAAGGMGSVKGSSSCPNFNMVVSSTASGVEDYRVPTPRNPHDKAGSVNVSNEYYFGGYASTLTTSSNGVVDLHSSSESPEFVDGNSFSEYASPSYQYGSSDANCAGADCDSIAIHFAEKGPQRSCDNVAAVMPLYLSPQPDSAPVRQQDRQTSSWHRSAALMVPEDDVSILGGGLTVDTSYDERIYGVYHQQQMSLLEAARRQQQQMQQLQYQQHQQMMANQKRAASCGYFDRSGYFAGQNQPVPRYAQQGNGAWFNHQVPSPLAQQQQFQYPPRSYPSGGGDAYLDVPNVVDIHGHFHASFGMPMGPTAAVPPVGLPSYVSVGGYGGRPHTYQRQHSA